MRGIRLFLAILLAGILTQNIFVEAAESNGIDAVQLHGMTLHTTQLDLTGLSAAGKGWGMGPERDALNRPLTAKQYQSTYSQLGVDFLVPTEEKTIYLTYDAGVEAGYTNRVLDILKEKRVSALFFCVGTYVKANPTIVQRIIEEGHVLGNHSMTHPAGGYITLDAASQSSQIMDMHEYVKQNFGYSMYLFRAPSGEFSELAVGLANNCGYRNVYYSFAYKDWVTNAQPNESESLEKMKQQLHPGAIYMFHVNSSTSTNVLEAFIDFARSQGYGFGDYRDTLSEDASVENEETTEQKTEQKTEKKTRSDLTLQADISLVRVLWTGTDGVTFSYRNLSGEEVDGYEIQYSVDPSFPKDQTISLYSHTNEASTTGIEKNIDYYVRIRACVNRDGQRIWSDWGHRRIINRKR